MFSIPQISFYWNTIGGDPAVGYTAEFYGAGLDPIPANRKTIYTDTNGGTPAPNPVTFDALGRISVSLGDGGYKVVIRDPNGVSVATFDNVSGSSGFGTGFASSIEALRDLNVFNPPFTYVSGYYESGDGGDGMFYWDANDTTPDDGGYTIAPSSSPVSGRWKRVPDEDGAVRAASFGFVGTLAGSFTAQLAAADTYATAVGKPLRISGDGTSETAAITLNSKCIIFDRVGAAIRGTVSKPSITIHGQIDAGNQEIFKSASVALSGAVTANARWFGVKPYEEAGDFDNASALNDWKTCGAGAFYLPPGTYRCSSTFDLNPTVPATMIGTITESVFPYNIRSNPEILLPPGSTIKSSFWTTSEYGHVISENAQGFDVFGNFDVGGNLSGTVVGTKKAGTYLPTSGMLSGLNNNASEVSFQNYPAEPTVRKVIPGNLLSSNLDRLIIRIRGHYSGDWQTSYGGLNILLGGYNILGLNGTSVYLGSIGGRFSVNVEIVRQSSTSFVAYVNADDFPGDGVYAVSGQIQSHATVVAIDSPGFSGDLNLDIFGYRGEDGGGQNGTGYIDYLDVGYQKFKA